MPVKPPEAPSIESMDGETKTRRATMRGTTYVLRELGADEYEACLKSATSPDENGRDRIDNAVLLRLMVGKSLVEPKIPVSEVWKKPYPVLRKINDIVEELHYTPEESDEEKSKREEEEKGEAKG